MIKKGTEPLTWLQSLAIKVVTAGRIPGHIAFIMDGNRRYAQKNSLRKIVGHEMGSTKLTKILDWCNKLNIKEVTVFAFSVDNFKRNKEERDELLEMIQIKLAELLDEIDSEYLYIIRFIGCLHMLPQKIRSLSAKIELATMNNNTDKYFNIALAYGAQYEITRAIRNIVRGVKERQIDSDDVDGYLLQNCLYTKDCTYPDLLVRTSNVVRVSDFLLYQTSGIPFYFINALWPGVNIWNLITIIFLYQRNYDVVRPLLETMEKSELSNVNKFKRTKKFLDSYRQHYLSMLKELSKDM